MFSFLHFPSLAQYVIILCNLHCSLMCCFSGSLFSVFLHIYHASISSFFLCLFVGFLILSSKLSNHSFVIFIRWISWYSFIHVFVYLIHWLKLKPFPALIPVHVAAKSCNRLVLQPNHIQPVISPVTSSQWSGPWISWALSAVWKIVWSWSRWTRCREGHGIGPTETVLSM